MADGRNTFPRKSSLLHDDDDAAVNLFWTDDGWCVDLREHRNYPVYGEGDWTLRTDNAGIGCRG